MVWCACVVCVCVWGGGGRWCVLVCVVRVVCGVNSWGFRVGLKQSQHKHTCTAAAAAAATLHALLTPSTHNSNAPVTDTRRTYVGRSIVTMPTTPSTVPRPPDVAAS
jgi:hypothetical protein